MATPVVQGKVVQPDNHHVVQAQPVAVVVNPVVQQGQVVTPQVTTKQEQQWVSDFCGCCSYSEIDSHGRESCMWCPYFVPMGLCGTCFLLGRIQSLWVREEQRCCGMGAEGWMCCLISTPINLCGPLGGFCWFVINSINLRQKVVQRYNIKEDTSCPTTCIGICYPLSLFQVLMKLRRLHSDSAL